MVQAYALECTRTHSGSEPGGQLFPIKMSFVLESRPCCLDLAEASQAVESWLRRSCGIDRTGVPGR